MKNRGFTLIELTIVISVMLVITLISLKWVSKKANLEGQAKQLTTDIRYIQHKAITSAARYRINFSSNQYTFTDLTGNSVAHPGTAGSNIITLDSDITLSYDASVLPNGYVVFDSRGVPFTDTATAELLSVATITLTGGADTKMVTVTPETGKVTVN